MSNTTNWKLILGAVLVVLICGIQDITCCSGGGDKAEEKPDGCTVDGKKGNGTEQGTCPEGKKCGYSGVCTEGHKTDVGEALGNPINITDFVAGDAMAFTDDGIDHVLEAIEMGADYEGDIVLTADQLGERAAITSANGKWPKSGQVVTIPYVISSSFDQNDRNVIAKAIQEYESKTCLRFKARASEADYISIIRGGGCWSYIGKTGNKQQLSLGHGCVYNGVIIHEFMHAVGFYHEQSRTDRDKHVTIHLENVRGGMEHNFQKCSSSQCTEQGLAYDLQSVMHYSKGAFSKNGKPTISCKNEGACNIGGKINFSDLDVKDINKLYDCNGGTGPTGPTAPCVDEDEYCPDWAAYGFCTGTYEAWMKAHCKKSCDVCPA